MKILLINPPPFEHGENARILERSPVQTYTMPLGLGYLASFLQREGYDVRIIDAYVRKLSYEKLGELIKDQKPHVIGITCLSDQRASWFKLIHLIRSIDSSIKIVLGGPHPTLMMTQVLTHFRPDVIVIGEGEETMFDLLKAWGTREDNRQVKGIAYMEGEDIIVTRPRERIKNLDRLPFPAHDVINFDDYQGWDFIRKISHLLGLLKPPQYASISTSRGCVGDCSFCSAPLIWKKRWTKRSASNVVDEIEMLNREYGIEFIIITDDVFTVDQTRVISICEEMLKRNIQVLWGFETVLQSVSYELLHLAKQAGCCCILYGVESGSKTVLSNISKKIKIEEVVKAFNMTRDVGIISGAFLMVGNPGESEKSIKETLNLLNIIKPDIALPQITMITPGTRLFDRAKSKGHIDENYWLTDLPFPYYTCERDLETLIQWYQMLSN
jgi:radical SAM superfamily enzyme YgiQ (UPF0313 family)